MKKYLSYLILATTVLLLSNSCKTHKSAEEPTGSIIWMVTSMYGKSIEEVEFMRGSPSIIFNDSTSFDGSTGCNQYRAKYAEDSSGVKITVGPMTKMACPGEEENIFIKALTETNRVKREEDVMIFFNNDEEVLRFRKVI